jgi:hypothetical protein
MAGAFMAAARLRLALSSGPDGVDDELGTFERIPDKEDRAIDSEMNVRFNMRGYVLFIVMFLKHQKN